MSLMTRYDYLCTDCDSLLQVTTAEDFDLWRPWCGCGSANIIRINKYTPDSHEEDIEVLGECRKCELNDPLYSYTDCPV